MSLVDLAETGLPVQVSADVVIVGGGPAGITIALELANEGLDVALLESGALDLNDEVQGLYRGAVEGLDYFDLDRTRLRFLGGSSNHWEGWCRTLDAEDFVGDPESGSPAWPLTKADLEAEYGRAVELCELGGDDFELAGWAAESTHSEVPVDENRVRNSVLLRSPPTRFGERYLAELQASEDVTVYLNANVVEVMASGDRVLGVRLADMGGATGTIEADTVVLATGGIENARLLLASDQEHRGGLGNRHDQVGRYFMEHPHYSATTIFGPADPGEMELYTAAKSTAVGGVDLRALFTLPHEVRQAAGIRNVSMQLRPLRDSGLADLARDPLYSPVQTLLQDIESASTVRGMECRVIGEQVPNPESRVTLSNQTDQLGMRRVSLTWRLQQRDYDTLRIGSELILRELGALGLGRAHSDLHAGLRQIPVRGGNHHMGTTRMHDDPRQGVVDRDAQVHGVRNLYVAGSSVFPTGGWANPTLTLVALAARLGRHLRKASR